MIFFPPDPPRALAEMRRVLRPSGRVASSVFARWTPLTDGQLAAYRTGLKRRLESFQDEGGGFRLEQRAVAVVADI